MRSRVSAKKTRRSESQVPPSAGGVEPDAPGTDIPAPPPLPFESDEDSIVTALFSTADDPLPGEEDEADVSALVR